MSQPTFKISTQLLEATLNYLATRPYREIAGLIAELSKLEKIEDAAPAPAAEPKEPEK